MSELPIREQIIQALAARVGATRRLAMYDERDLPITVLQEGDDTAAEGLYGMTNVSTSISIARAIRMTGVKDDDWYTQLNVALADLIAEVFDSGEDPEEEQEPDGLDELIHGIEYVSGSVDLLTDAGVGAGVAVTVNVRYSFVHGNPYSQDADSEFTDLPDDEEEESEGETEEET